MSVNAFHEKAGRSQGDWFWYLLVTLFLSGRGATVATLPSALFDERFLCARCKLGVLVSAGAAICLSTFLPVSAAPLADSCPGPAARSARCTRECVHSATRCPPARAPARCAVPDSVPLLSPHSYCVRCTRATAPRSSWPICGTCSSAPFAPAPTRLAPESASDPFALSHYDVSPDTTTPDRFGPTEPVSGRRSDHLSFGSIARVGLGSQWSVIHPCPADECWRMYCYT
jgi:hypothetical protein